ncbi:PDZ domain-containing protein [Thalassotalea hakodatensis]|uniref:PDZ domain-containing protein n=1 Tax=Thalassotalea hakodatensis TaxID=3030492 RepID=UPI00257331B2|nr:PDZ domain-containing protein [Thalassotalea hakodatensis]
MQILYKVGFSAMIAMVSIFSEAGSNSCATVSFDSSYTKIGTPFIIDNRIDDRKFDVGKLAEKKIVYKFKPGLRTVHFNVFGNVIELESDIEGELGRPKIHELVPFLFNFKANRHYTLSIKSTANSNSISVKNETEKQCHITNKTEVFGQTRALILKTDPFPQAIEDQLNKVFGKITNYYKDKKSYKSGDFFALEPDEYFGLVLDEKEYDKKSIKILSVLPFSLAYNLGLRSGDIILSLGDERGFKRNAKSTLDDYLYALDFSDTIRFEVERDGNKKILSDDYYPNLIPESAFSFNHLANETLLVDIKREKAFMPKQLKFEYQRLMLLLNAYYLSTGINSGDVVISRLANESKITFELLLSLDSLKTGTAIVRKSELSGRRYHGRRGVTLRKRIQGNNYNIGIKGKRVHEMRADRHPSPTYSSSSAPKASSTKNKKSSSN